MWAALASEVSDGTPLPTVYADLVVGDEIIRAVDTNLVAGSGTSIVGWTTNVPSDACAPSSYVTFNRKATGPDCTQVTPDFSTSATFLKGGYFWCAGGCALFSPLRPVTD